MRTHFLGRRGDCISQHWRPEHYCVFPPHGAAAFGGSRGTSVRAVASIRNWTAGIGGPGPPFSRRADPGRESRPAKYNLGERDRPFGEVIQSTIDHTGRLRFHGEQRPGNRPADYFTAARTGLGYAQPGLRSGFRTESARVHSRGFPDFQLDLALRRNVCADRLSRGVIQASLRGKVTSTSTPPASTRRSCNSDWFPCKICNRVRRLPMPTPLRVDCQSVVNVGPSL